MIAVNGQHCYTFTLRLIETCVVTGARSISSTVGTFLTLSEERFTITTRARAGMYLYG
jgi:hypothetical protein